MTDLWPDIGPYVGPTVNRNAGGMRSHRGVVLHIASGFYQGTISWQLDPKAKVSSHFIVARDGRACQMVALDDMAWAQKAGNPDWISVELEGFAPDDPQHSSYPGWETATPAQLAVCAAILRKANQVYGVPLQLAASPSGAGLGHHSMGAENGVDWGHPSCPGEAIKAQKPTILAQAQAGGNLSPVEDEMKFVAQQTDVTVPGSPYGKGAIFLCDGFVSEYLTLEDFNHTVTLYKDGTLKLSNNPEAARGGWFPRVPFGKLPATAPTGAVAPWTQDQINAAIEAGLADGATKAVLVEAAFEGAQKAETQ